MSDYDQWRLAGPAEPLEVGMKEGEECNRLPEPDEDMGRARPRRCKGTMIEVEGVVLCDTCHELA